MGLNLKFPLIILSPDNMLETILGIAGASLIFYLFRKIFKQIQGHENKDHLKREKKEYDQKLQNYRNIRKMLA